MHFKWIAQHCDPRIVPLGFEVYFDLQASTNARQAVRSATVLGSVLEENLGGRR
jgi:hypothetical protein